MNSDQSAICLYFCSSLFVISNYLLFAFEFLENVLCQSIFWSISQTSSLFPVSSEWPNDVFNAKLDQNLDLI
jgi:hypothetical protein